MHKATLDSYEKFLCDVSFRTMIPDFIVKFLLVSKQNYTWSTKYPLGSIWESTEKMVLKICTSQSPPMR